MSRHQHEPSSAGAAPGLRSGLALVLLAALGSTAGCERPTHPSHPLPPDGFSTLATAGAGGRPRAGDVEPCANAGCIAPGPIPQDASCYQLINHAANDRAAPFLVQPAEGVSCFFYDVPWVEPSGLVAWQTRVDAPAMREWQLYTSAAQNHDGAVETCIGGGDARDAQLLMAHSTGGNDVLMPEGVGLRLPAPGTRIVVQWRSLNEGGVPVPDASSVVLCTRPTARLARIAGVTVLGTENIGGKDGLGLGQQSVNGACPLEGETPVQLLMVAPHMNRLGRGVRMTAQRASGESQPFFAGEFNYDRQVMWQTNVTLRPGDRVVTHCTYDNVTGMRVPFRSSLLYEQCYVYAISAPAGALDRASPSALGITNTCMAF
jgi:hypothetical protein